MTWPGLPASSGAMLLAVQYQLEQTQWLQPGFLLEQQLRQFRSMLRHAVTTVPFYKDRLGDLDLDSIRSQDDYRQLPLLARSEVQEAGERMLSAAVPTGHLPLNRTESSGSTARPIVTIGTEVTKLMWQALLLREHIWHKRDFTGKLAAIRSKTVSGDYPGWGAPVDLAFHTGQAALLDLSRDVDEQLDWLREQAPDYLVSFASNIHLLARRSSDRRLSIPGLREVRTYGETLHPELRAVVRKAWGVDVVDSYSSEELGYIALQCPQRFHYHVQSESLIVEVLRADGSPCTPGEIGQIVVSTLHNFAMPLIRYVSGDFAQVGAPCVCGRGLPVLSRILGRQRNILTLPDGQQRWPSFPSETWRHLAPVRQLQLIQRARDRIEARVVVQRSLNEAEREALTHAWRDCLGYAFAIDIVEVAEIPRSASLKFEDFISEIATS